MGKRNAMPTPLTRAYAVIEGDLDAIGGATLVVDDKLAIKHCHSGDLGCGISIDIDAANDARYKTQRRAA